MENTESQVLARQRILSALDELIARLVYQAEHIERFETTSAEETTQRLTAVGSVLRDDGIESESPVETLGWRPKRGDA